MADDVIHVESIETLSSFAGDLTSYLKKVREIETDIRVRLARLGERWEDRKYLEFRESFERVTRQLKEFEGAAEMLPHRIKAYEELLKRIHSESLPR